MAFKSSKNWFAIWVHIFSFITYINPFTPTYLKAFAFLTFLINCYNLFSKFTVILEEDQLIYERKIMLFTIFHKNIPFKSIEKFEFEYKSNYIKIHPLNTKRFYFEINSPEFIYAIEKLSEKQQIPFNYVVKQKKVRKKEIA